MEFFLGSNLKFLRDRAGLTLAAMAEAIGIKKNTINNYENGITEPGLDSLVTLSSFFGHSLDDLIRVDLSYSPDGPLAPLLASALIKNNTVVPLIEGAGAMSFPDYFFAAGPLVGLQVRGEAMAPTIRPGDYVIGRPIEPSAVRNGEVYMVHYPGENGRGFVVRRCYYYHGDETLVLAADHPDEFDMTIPITADLKLYHVEACLTTQLAKVEVRTKD